jgi:hypothetical protein
MQHKVGAANCKNRRAAIKFMTTQGCDSLALSETYLRIPLVAGLGDYRAFYVQGYTLDERRGAKDNPVLVRRRFPTLGVIGWRGSAQSVPIKFAPARFIHAVVFRGPLGVTATFSIHANFVGNDGPDAPRVKEYARWSESLDKALWFLKHQDVQRVIVAGDGNTRPDRPTPGWSDIHDVLAAHQYGVEPAGVDVLAWSPRLRPAQPVKVIPRETLGSDHPALIGVLTDR